MIVSASYKTDIPAFYGEWFMNRLRAGYCKMVNPYNAHQVYRVSLAPEDVDGFVFWTKNLGPFFDRLGEVHRAGFPFIVQYTVNGYPRALESRVVDAKRSVEHIKRIASEFGPRTAIWRYDTVVVSSVTPIDFHRRNFEELARSLEGHVDEVVISFAQIYKKTLRNMNESARENGFTWEDPPDIQKRRMISEFAGVARARGMQLTVCSQPALVPEGVAEARCVDARRLNEIGGRLFKAELKGARKECGCFQSKDIGDYDTCPHGCVYCYAVQSREVALKRYRQHDPTSEFLFTRSDATPVGEAPPETAQVSLFKGKA